MTLANANAFEECILAADTMRTLVSTLPPFLMACSMLGQDMATSAHQGSGRLKVHFIDVGQADSIFVQTPSGKNMLIDAGNNDDASVDGSIHA